MLRPPLHAVNGPGNTLRRGTKVSSRCFVRGVAGQLRLNSSEMAWAASRSIGTARSPKDWSTLDTGPDTEMGEHPATLVADERVGGR